MAQTVHADGNFLVPNATFIAEVIAFVLILLILRRYVVPPIQKAMRERQEMIRRQAEDSDKAKEQLAQAEAEYQRALAEARVEAARIRESARAEAQQVVEELRTQAQEEQSRIVARGEEQLQHQRTHVVRELRAEIGSLAVELSEKIVGQRLADEAQVRATVDSFLSDLEHRDTAGTGT